MIPAEIRYETYNGEFLAIIEAFMTWKHYLENSQHEIFIFTKHNNPHKFMDIKSLSSIQVHLVQNSFIITFKLIIIRTKEIELLIPYFNDFSKI